MENDWDVKVIVPCSSANLGPGFDVLGLGLSLYMTYAIRLTCERKISSDYMRIHYGFSTYAKKVPKSEGSKVIFHGQGKGSIPEDESNMILQVINRVLKEQKVVAQHNVMLTIHNDIPIGKGTCNDMQ